MKNTILMILSVVFLLGYSSDLLSQRTNQKGYNYKAHQKRNAKHAKINAKKFKAAGGDLTRMKCGKKRRTKTVSKAARRRA